MDKTTAQLFKLSQVGFVVTDVQRIADSFEKLLGIGPLKVVDWPIPGIDPQCTYRGAPGSWKMRLGFVEANNMSLEFIQPLEGESIYQEFLDENGPGLHHLRFSVADFDQAVSDFEARGYEKIASGSGVHHGSRWAFFDTRTDFEGLIIELRTELSEAAEKDQWIK